MANETDFTSVTGVTSWSYHITMWILVVAGILGNVSVIAWRCWRKQLNLHSGLITSLAIADLCMCSHFLIQEVMLAYPVFADHVYVKQDETENWTNVDEGLCLSITFLAYFSASAIMLLATGIAFHIYCQFRREPHRYSRLVFGYLVFSWLFSAVFASVVTWKYKEHNKLPQSYDGVGEFSLYVLYGCVNSVKDSGLVTYLVIICGINGLLSLLVVGLYINLCLKLRKHKVLFPNNSENIEINQLRIRLIVISILNLVCTWWPAFAIYLYAYVHRASVYDGSVSPDIAIPFFVLTAVLTVANPVIYTIASRSFFTRMRGCCSNYFLCRRHMWRVHVRNADVDYNEDSDCCNTCCLVRLSASRTLEGEIFYQVAVSNDTEQTSLFTD